MPVLPTNYGSVPTTSEDTDQQQQQQQPEEDGPTMFRESSLLYVQERVLSPKERWQKFMLAGIPLLGAIIIVGGAVYLLCRQFDIFYPPTHGDQSPQYTPRYAPYHNLADDEPSPVPPRPKPRGPPIQSAATAPSAPAPEPTAATSSSSSSSTSSSDCSAHPKCNDLGLTGICCPTLEGVVLGCC